MRDAAERLLEISAGDADITTHSPSRAAWLLINAEANLRRCDSPFEAGAALPYTLQTFSALALAATEKVPKTRYRQSAAPMLADALCSKRRHRGLSCTTTMTGATVREFVQIARAAGDRALTVTAAQKAIKLSMNGQNRRASPIE
jgi:hypothetical protein